MVDQTLKNPLLFISNPAYSFWINASAGTGKTTILVKRVLGLLANKVEAKRILCLTYTKAAAIEMAERIKQELSNWIFLQEEELVQILTNLLNREITKTDIAHARKLFIFILETENSLNIQTIHSFCQKIIRSFAFEIGISSDFALIKEEDYTDLIFSVKEQIYNKSYNDQLIFTALKDINLYGSEDSLNSVFREIAEKISFYTKIFKNASYLELNNNLKKTLKITSLSTQEIYNDFLEYYQDFSLARDILSAGNQSEQTKGDFLKIWHFLTPEEKLDRLDEYLDIFMTKEREPRKNLLSSNLKKKFPDLEIILLNEQDRIINFINRLNNFKLWKLSSALTIIASTFTKLFNKIKKEKNILDYHDLIHYTQELFVNNSAKDFVLYKIDSKLDHLLIDEAQDTSPEQWDIISKLTEDFFSGESYECEKSLFVVGDEKQSIYSFQGANHSFYHNTYNYFKQKILSSKRNFLELELDHSYRSSTIPLKLVDKIFNQQSIKNSVSSKITPIKHISMRSQDFGRIEVLPCITETTSAAQILANNIAMKIKVILDSKTTIDNHLVQPRDIMVIVKTRDDFYYKLIQSCNELNIPINGLDRINLNNYIGIEDFILIIKFALMPHDDLNLATILKSPLFNISEENLLEICALRSNSVWQEIQNRANLDEFIDIYSKLNAILNNNYMKPSEFINYILYDLEAKEKFIARLGQEFIFFLNNFWERVLQFEQENIPTLHAFLEWFIKSKHEIKKTFSPEENKAQILTSHGAKGLQAKIVILPDTTKMFSTKVDSLLEFSENILYWNGNSNYQNDYIIAKKLCVKAEKYHEYLRLLYVALTRAENWLIIAGFSNLKLNKDCWYNLILEACMSFPYEIEDDNIIISSDKINKNFS